MVNNYTYTIECILNITQIQDVVLVKKVNMRCPFCGKSETKVTNKRDNEGIVRRRRECLKCSQRFTTYERPEESRITVVKKDGRREPFKREKLLGGMVRACEKRPVPMDKIEEAVNGIEARLAKRNKEVTSVQIGEMVMAALKKLDKVAYVRFASVYKDFQDVADFKKEIREVTK